MIFPKMPPAVVEAMREHIEEELEAHLPPDVYKLIEGYGAMCMLGDNVGISDFEGYVDDLGRAAWFWANGETEEASLAALRKSAELQAEPSKRKPASKKG